MAIEREVFTPIEDANGHGQSYRGKAEGDAPSTDLGALGFSFKDSSGNVILPQLNADGTMPVSFSTGTCISGTAQVADTTASMTDVVTLTLALTKNYSNLELSVSSTKTTVWEVVSIDDVGGSPTETKIMDSAVITGPGQFCAKINLDCGDFTTVGGTGTQNLVLRANQLQGGASNVGGYLAIKES